MIGETVQFIEVGVSLQVTPTINEDGFITMAIRPEISTVEDYYDARYSVPIVQKAYAETTVMVKDGETIIIGGMIEEAKVSKMTQVPLLGSIPLLGIFFRSEAEVTRTREMVVFLTPRIITGAEPFLKADALQKKTKPLRVVGPNELKNTKPMR